MIGQISQLENFKNEKINKPNSKEYIAAKPAIKLNIQVKMTVIQLKHKQKLI